MIPDSLIGTKGLRNFWPDYWAYRFLGTTIVYFNDMFLQTFDLLRYSKEDKEKRTSKQRREHALIIEET